MEIVDIIDIIDIIDEYIKNLTQKRLLIYFYDKKNNEYIYFNCYFFI